MEGSETVGFIDIGTNSVHLLVSRFYPGSGVSPLFHDKESIRLGRSLYSDGRIDEETVERVSMVISRFAATAKSQGAEKIVACATCACREAPNTKDLLDGCKGVDVRVIPGTEEARLISLGVFGPNGPAERSLNIDIGGGSTEVMLRENGQDLFLDSLAIGSVRYAYGMGVDCSRPVSRSDYTYLQRCVDIASYRSAGIIRSMGFKRAYGSSGTMEALALACASRRGDHDASYFLRSELTQLMSEIIRLEPSRRVSFQGINKSRSDIIVSGGAIAEELMQCYGIERIEISHNGLREGMQVDHMMSAGYTCFDARDSSVRALAIRCGYDPVHVEKVQRMCLTLFDNTRAAGLHNMGSDIRNLLSNAAVLHDIGELVNYNNHHILSQVMIENSDMVGFDIEELHAMGLMVRFHHKKFPNAKDSLLSGLSPADSLSIRMCSMFLRIADVIDRHRNSVVTSLGTAWEDGRFVLLMESSGDAEIELWRLDRLKQDFRKLFGAEMEARLSHILGKNE